MNHDGHGTDADRVVLVLATLPASLLVPLAVAAAPLLAYGVALAVLRRRHRGAGRTGGHWRTGRTVAFGCGVVSAAVAVSPWVELTGSPARAHMAQHVLLGMVAPLGLVLGAPVTLALAVLPVAARRRGTAALRSGPARVLTHPLTAGCVHVGGLYALYLTPLYARTLQSPVVHGLVLTHFLLAGTLFAWALAGPERGTRRPGLAPRVGVLIGASAAHGYLAKLLYARAPDLPPGGRHHSVAELQEAARWMSYAGDVAEVLLAVALCAQWYRRAGRRRAGDRADDTACDDGVMVRSRTPGTTSPGARATGSAA